MSGGGRSRALRLAFLVPLTPWPVLLWIQSQGRYMWSALHSAEALNAVHLQALLSIIATSGIALGLLCLARPSLPLRAHWSTFAFVNALFLFVYVEMNAVAYA